MNTETKDLIEKKEVNFSTQPFIQFLLCLSTSDSIFSKQTNKKNEGILMKLVLQERGCPPPPPPPPTISNVRKDVWEFVLHLPRPLFALELQSCPDARRKQKE
ncbi:hypothetical protein CDAR_315741 [Caerostris darwini]|uniref:Uncharacterized protein n=1 Tax=Caerostris darwini TaxID=1538125 RepID=A0AAV4PX43_9ARAC|nr:hypothetical protein CDAR_315741 [Caerostris darwini]